LNVAARAARADNALTEDIIREHGLSPDEYQLLVAALGREPRLTELGIFSVMWSEHCSYKSSRVWLKKLPTEGPQVIQGPVVVLIACLVVGFYLYINDAIWKQVVSKVLLGQ